jgi:hypothetical protein
MFLGCALSLFHRVLCHPVQSQIVLTILIHEISSAVYTKAAAQEYWYNTEVQIIVYYVEKTGYLKRCALQL